MDDTSVFCLAWLDVEVTHERYWGTLGKFGQPPETKNVSQQTNRKSKEPCQQQAAMNIDCSNFLCSSLAPKIGKSTCPPCMSRLRLDISRVISKSWLNLNPAAKQAGHMVCSHTECICGSPHFQLSKYGLVEA